jgi:GxxExxY protein
MNDQSPANGDLPSEPDAATDALATELLDAAIEVHRALGPGFLETIYEHALCLELSLRGIPFARQAIVRVHYKGELVGDARIDLLIAERLIVELKAIDQIAPIHLAQAMSYLKATGLPLALLVNFNAPVLLRGVRRVVLSSTQKNSWRSWRPGGDF